jgi:hypothetical protein
VQVSHGGNEGDRSVGLTAVRYGFLQCRVGRVSAHVHPLDKVQKNVQLVGFGNNTNSMAGKYAPRAGGDQRIGSEISVFFVTK